mmetsp:Transcript_16264/g.15599  ORF Transcript_16264/g.15599 Transcript_16264/m.15599 type:complete len:226 (+) Transcript_16264:97-774(+)
MESSSSSQHMSNMEGSSSQQNESIDNRENENQDAEDDADGDDDDDGPVLHIKLQNIVSTVTLGVRLDLDKITSTARNAEYNPKRFQAVIVRIREPKTTALIFASGKMIITGAKTVTDSRNAALKFTAIIQKVGFPATFKDFKVQNLTATCDAGFPIRLEGLIYAHSTCATYEPELFPGLVYRMVEPKVSLLIFVSGKIVLTGAKTVEQLTSAFSNIYPHLLELQE